LLGCSGIIHMNGRIYDPTLGRFLQADPFIQAPDNSQSYNRYSYVLNNPLSYTDPSGYFFKKLWKGIKKFASIIVAAVISFYCPTCAGWAIGMISGAAGAALNGGNILQGALLGAFTGGLGGPMNSVASFITNGLVGGIASKVSGGKFSHGFWAAGLSGLAGGQIGKIGSPLGRIVTRSIIGGTISKLTGGKFANGAVGAAMAQILAEDWSSTPKVEIDPNKDYLKTNNRTPVSAEDAQKQFDALKADLINKGVEGAELLDFQNVYAVGSGENGTWVYTTKNFDIFEETMTPFGEPIKGSLLGVVINGKPTLFRNAFSETVTHFRNSKGEFVETRYNQTQSARFMALHEIGHIINPSFTETQTNDWSEEYNK